MRVVAAAVALVALPIAIWWIARPSPAEVVARPVAPPVEPRAVSLPPLPAAPRASTTAERLAEVSAPPVAPANSGEPHAEGMLPHPITPEHERIFRENSLIGNLNGAMDAKDVNGIRALLKTYRDEYPEDDNVLHDGYALIADCMEKPAVATRAAAQRYYDERRDSGLRRYIRRYCLDAE